MGLGTMYTGKTKNLGIIGYPVAHSLSPAMQSAAIVDAGLDYRYIAMPVHPDALASAVEGLKALNFRGFNVTIPHKVNLIPLLDDIDEDAKMIGAVNTVLIEAGKLIGYNTDSSGFIRSLRKNAFEPEGKSAVILGAGGAARAVLWGLIASGMKSLTIGVRDCKKAQPLISIFGKFIRIKALYWDDPEFSEALQTADLLVNSTPLGMSPNTDAEPPVDWTLIRQEAFVSDLIYTPAETAFLRAAKKNKNRCMNGEGMLVEQGAEALERWTGRKVRPEIMARALRDSLRCRA